MKELHILEQVYVDLKDGSDFYEKQDPGCGDYFYGSLRAEMLALTQFHGLHPRRYGLRCMVSRTFPHGIFYREKEAVVEVVAVFDLRRDPKWIRGQLRKR